MTSIMLNIWVYFGLNLNQGSWTQAVSEFVMKNRLRISYSAVSILQLNENLLTSCVQGESGHAIKVIS